MNTVEENKNVVDDYTLKKITSRYLLTLIKPILADELVASFRFDRAGLRISFCNGQKFHLRIDEL